MGCFKIQKLNKMEKNKIITEMESMTIEKKPEYCKCVAELSKKITFDGINFWLNGEKIGKLKPKDQLRSNIPKKDMIKIKQNCIKKMMLCEV